MPNGLRFIDSARPELPLERIAAVLREVWGIEGPLEELGGDRDQNLSVDARGGRRLLKISQPGEEPGLIDLQLAALRHVAVHDPGLPVPRVVPTLRGEWTHALVAEGGGRHMFRVLEYLPGRPIGECARTPGVLRAAGALIARLDRALRGFFHPAAGHALLWDIRQAPAMRAWCDTVTHAARRERVATILDEFAETVLPVMAGLRSQVVHGDATGENLLLAGEPPEPSGVIDFGDMVHAPLAQELAIAMADVPWGMGAPWTAACELASGFDAVTPLEDEEIAALWDLARARLAIVMVGVSARAARRPGGAGSMAGMEETCWHQLTTLEALGRHRALGELRRRLRLPEAITVAAAPDDTLARRRRRLPALELFYPGRPLHLVSGRGMWVFDHAGKRYLDCYNNVPHVGHAHPHVVNAVARQTSTLNINTRYLYESILEYSERLAGLLPGELGVFLFVNSGSEANDLAWRIARAVTGGSGALVTANAYHGATAATAALSPYGRTREKHVRTVAAPDDCCSLARRERQPGVDVDDAARELAAAGHRVAAFIVDPTFSSDGILDAPAGYLDRLFAAARTAGGLCVSDEVQSGFGRLGVWWGFETQGVVPDIVTLGKPIANGYPAGAVITTPRIMEAFARQRDYFSTFGGNPVACMAGLAVIDVIEREGLLDRARDVGNYLRLRLADLADRHPIIGDVRGRGLFQGVELVRDRASAEPADSETRAIAARLRDEGVLVATEGPHGNVLKIRPPMICETRHVDILVDALDRALTAEDVGRQQR